MPMTDQMGFPNPEMSVPGQVCNMLCDATASCSPCQPPTRLTPMTVSGASAAMMTKNCSTSL